MDASKRISKPGPAGSIELRQHCREVSLVFWPIGVLGLEEQDDLGPAIRDTVVGPFDHLGVGSFDPFVPPADPRFAVGGLPKDVEAPAAGRGLPHPRLLVPVESRRRLRKRPHEAWIGQLAVRDEELEPGKSLSDLAKPVPGNGNL